MKAYEPNAIASRKRIKKVHSKAKFAGLLYLFGTIILAVLAILPMPAPFAPVLSIKFAGENNISVMNVWNAFASGLSVDLVIAILYLCIVLTGVVNIIRSLAKLGRLMKKTSRYANGCNRNMRAMDDLAAIFSGTFAAIINFNFLIYVMGEEPSFSILAYAIIAVGLLIHFFAGVIGGNVSLFIVGATVEEQKRENGVGIFFVRNLLQVIATAAIVYIFGVACTLYQLMPDIMAFNFAGIMAGGIMNILKLALMVLAIVWIMVLVKHATAATEFNRWGMDGPGMKNYRIFSFFTFITCGASFPVILLYNGNMIYNYLIVAIIAFVFFLLDCIIKPGDPRAMCKGREDICELPDMPPVPQRPMMPTCAPMTMCAPRPMCAPMPSCSNYCTGCGPQGISACASPAMAPMQAPDMYRVNSPACLTRTGMDSRRLREQGYTLRDRDDDLRQARALAKVNTKQEKKNRKKAKKLNGKEKDFVKNLESAEMTPVAPPAAPDTFDVRLSLPASLFPGNMPMPVPSADKKWEVKCPTCGKTLEVMDGAPYNRCPGCGKVFEVRKGEKSVQK